MTLLSFFPRIQEAWQTYKSCSSQLWWPLSFLLLAPLAILIVFGLIIPLGLVNYGWINFNHPFLNIIYCLIVAALIYGTFIPFLDGLYQVIKSSLNGDPVNENTGFTNIHKSTNTGIAMLPVILLILLFSYLSDFSKLFKIALLLSYMHVIFTPILSVNNNQSNPWNKAWESIQFTLKNRAMVARVWLMRILILSALALPWIIIGALGHHLFLIFLTLLVGLPFFIYCLYKFLPFYFFYPAFIYQYTQNK